MEGKKLFDYEQEEKKTNNTDSKKEKNVILKILQVILSVIMAVLHL